MSRRFCVGYRSEVGAVAVVGDVCLSVKGKRKIEIPYNEGLVKDIRSTVGIQSYDGHGYEGGISMIRAHKYPAPPALCDGGALRDACCARPMRVYGYPCCRAACVRANDATECARWRLTSPGSVYTKSFLFLMMYVRRDSAKSVRESNNDLNRLKSWDLALWSVARLVTPLLARACSTRGRTV